VIPKLFVGKKWTTKIICPNCKCSRFVNFSKYKKLARTVKVRIKCKCGYAQVALLERRDRHRKPTNLKGIYISKLVGRNIDQESIEVKNLSVDGIRFKFMDNHKYEFKPGDELLVEFSLNEKPGSLIRKEAIIKSFNRPSISAQFKNKNSFNENLFLKIFLYE
jgi:hypothetical protein